MFEGLIREVASRFGLGDKADILLRSVVGHIFKEQPGGLGGFIDLFKKAGQGDVVSSWLGGGPPREMSADRLESVLGGDTLGRLASAAGLSKSSIMAPLAYLLPKLIGLLTRDGVPTGVPAAVSSYLTPPVRKAVPESSSNWLWWLLLPVLALLLWRWCAPRGVVAPSPTPLPVATPTAPTTTRPAVVASLPARVYFETDEKSLGPQAESVVAGVAAYLRDSPGVAVDITGYADKTGSLEANLEVAKERAKAVRDGLRAARVGEERMTLKPPVSITGTGTDAEARRVEITARP